MAATALTLCVTAGPAPAASIWSEVPSGTTSEISGIEFQGDGRFWYVTKAGEIFKRGGDGSFVRKLGPTSIPFNDIEFLPSSGTGFAVGNAGQVFRSIDAGETWVNVNPSGTPIPVSRKGTAFPICDTTEPLGNVNAVRFAGTGRVWIFAEGAQMARSESAANLGGVGQWVDANRSASNTCKLATGYADGIDDAFFVPTNPDVGYICTAYFGEVFLTTNNLAGSGASQAGDCGNGDLASRVMVGDPANPNRMWAVGPGGPNLSYTRMTDDGWATHDAFTLGNPNRRDLGTPHDVAFSGGTIVVAGDAGMLLNSTDGVKFYYVDADGALATVGWRAVGMAGPTAAAVGGQGGKLALTTQANAIPDIVAPTGTITGPDTTPANRATTFSASVADNAGGSGMDPNGYSWSASGIAGATGQTPTITFTAPGTYTLRVAFRDLAGNPGSATKSVRVTEAAADTKPGFSLPSASKPPITGGGARRQGGFYVVNVKGSFGAPPGLSNAQACSGEVFIRVFKITPLRLLKFRKARLGKTCRYSKKIRIKRSQVGNAKRLKLRISFGGNAFVAAVTRTYTIKVRR
jgi:photosystem II stability/assembly factor-like uncharacterized protein